MREENKLHTCEAAFVRFKGKQIKQRKPIEFKRLLRLLTPTWNGTDAIAEQHIPVFARSASIFSLRKQ